jgi:Flp pilus assembly protein TadG
VRRSDAGAGVVSTFVGASIFLVFLLFAAQLLLGLYTTSVVTAVAYDAAKTAAGSDALGRAGARDQAVASARRQLGHLGGDAEFQWAEDDDAVRLTVRVRRPPVLPGLLPGARPVITRTARVRAERVR